MKPSKFRRAQTITGPTGEWRNPQRMLMRAQVDAICTRVDGGIDAVAKAIGVNAGTVRVWKSRGTVTAPYAEKLCALVPELGVMPWMICSKIALAQFSTKKEAPCRA